MPRLHCPAHEHGFGRAGGRLAVALVLASLGLGVALAGGGCAGEGAPARQARRPAPVNAAPVAGVGAQIEAVLPRAQSAQVLVSITNTTDRALTVRRLRISWSAGRTDVRLAMALAAGATAEWAVELGPDAGDLFALYQAPLGAKVDVVEIARP
jgi:hypothetical protein